MKKVLVCDNCHAENPFFEHNCKSCGAFLHSKIANIDLWSTLWQILESPVKTAETIIQSDHKNFTVSILLFAAVKIGLSLFLISNAFMLLDDEISNTYEFILIGGLVFTVLLFAASVLITLLNTRLGITNRIKDNISIYIYSFLPIVLTLIFLAPIEIALFGTYWFTFNPSPLIFKPFVSYIMFFIEGLFFVWSIVLLITSTYAQTNSVKYSIVIGFILTAVLSFGTFYITKIIY